MDSEILEKINQELSFDELGDIVKTALSTLYLKLRTEEGFGCESQCVVRSIGYEPYDVELCIIDLGKRHGLEWPMTFWL